MGVLGQQDLGSGVADNVRRFGPRVPSNTAPNGQVIGDLWYDMVVGALKVWDGTNWVPVGSSAVNNWELNDHTLFFRTDADPCHRMFYGSGTVGDLGSMDGPAIMGNDRSALFANGCSGGVWRLAWDTANEAVYIRSKLSAGTNGTHLVDSETITTTGTGSGISIRDRDNNTLRSVIYSTASNGRLWRTQDALVWDNNAQLRGQQALNPSGGFTCTMAELVGGANVFNPGLVGVTHNFIIQAFQTVPGYVAGNTNITFPRPFPAGVLAVVASNNDSGGSAGGGAGVISFSNYSLTGCGSSAILSNTGAGITGGIRLGVIAVGW